MDLDVMASMGRHVTTQISDFDGEWLGIKKRIGVAAMWLWALDLEMPPKSLLEIKLGGPALRREVYLATLVTEIWVSKFGAKLPNLPLAPRPQYLPQHHLIRK
jgi:hypothetical protein